MEKDKKNDLETINKIKIIKISFNKENLITRNST